MRTPPPIEPPPAAAARGSSQSAAALSAAPAACSHDSGPSSGEREPSIATSAPIAAVTAKIAALRARFPAALAAASDVRLLDDPSAETIRAALATPKSRLATIDLPRRGDGAVHLTDDTSGLHIAFSLEGAAPAKIAIDGGLALYPSAAPGGGDVIHLPAPRARRTSFTSSAPQRRKSCAIAST